MRRNIHEESRHPEEISAITIEQETVYAGAMDADVSLGARSAPERRACTSHSPSAGPWRSGSGPIAVFHLVGGRGDRQLRAAASAPRDDQRSRSCVYAG